MSPLALRKQLLVVESELNRAHLLQEWQTLSGDVQALVRQVTTFHSLATSAASLVTGYGWFRSKASAGGEKSSWLHTILKGAELAGSLWSEFRPSGKKS